LTLELDAPQVITHAVIASAVGGVDVVARLEAYCASSKPHQQGRQEGSIGTNCAAVLGPVSDGCCMETLEVRKTAKSARVYAATNMRPASTIQVVKEELFIIGTATIDLVLNVARDA
jgi:hypothetical protein